MILVGTTKTGKVIYETVTSIEHDKYYVDFRLQFTTGRSVGYPTERWTKSDFESIIAYGEGMPAHYIVREDF